MRGILRLLLIPLLLAVGTGTAAAQQMMMVTPEPLDPSDPRAQVALQLASHLVAGDAGAAEAVLREKAAPALAEGGELSTQLQAVLQAIPAGGKYVVDGIDGVADTDFVMVRLRGPEGAPMLAVRMDIEREAPYRVRGIRSGGRLQMRDGDR